MRSVQVRWVVAAAAAVVVWFAATAVTTAATTLLDAAESGDRATVLRLLADRADPECARRMRDHRVGPRIMTISIQSRR
jgi:hypothetical protein